jgi:hypothetical protein
MLRHLPRRVVDALDARPDLEAATLLAAALGLQTGWLWRQLVWSGEGGPPALSVTGVVLGLAVGAAGALAAQSHAWVGRLQLLGLPALVVGLATGYAALQLALADLAERAVPLGLPPASELARWWPVGNLAVAVLIAAGWGATLLRLARLARSPGAAPTAAPIEQRAVAWVLAWLRYEPRQRPQGAVGRAVDRPPDGTRRRFGRLAAAEPGPARRRWWVIALGLLVGWPRLPGAGRR